APVKGAIVTGAGRGIGRAGALITSRSYFPFDRFRGGVLPNEKQRIYADVRFPPRQRQDPAAQEMFAHASLSLSG
ncbi:MAG: hypothetical protein ACE5JQ_09410, partial [Candidatus Methylomirabilales bacterium]